LRIFEQRHRRFQQAHRINIGSTLYDRGAIPGSVLKIEDDNFDPKTERQRQLWCLAISAKRYTLFLRDKDGEPALLREGINKAEDRYSEHGLGHLLNSADPESEDRNWIAQAWLAIVRRSLGLPTKPLRFQKRVAVGARPSVAGGDEGAKNIERREGVRRA
jgi:hypothetical protein